MRGSREETGEGMKRRRQCLSRGKGIGEGSRPKQQLLLPDRGWEGLLHNSAVFNCPAHTPPWILHYRTIGRLVLPPLSVEQTCSHIAKSSKSSLPPLWGGGWGGGWASTFKHTPHKPQQLTHHIFARLTQIGNLPHCMSQTIKSNNVKWVSWHLKLSSLIYVGLWSLMELFKGHCYEMISSYWAKEGHDGHTHAVVVVSGSVLICFSSALTQSFTKKVSRIKGNQFECCPAWSSSLAIYLKAEQKCHETTQGPDLDFTRWWVVALTSRPALFFLLASFSIAFHYSTSQSPSPSDTCTLSVLITLFPCSIALQDLRL